MLPSKTAARLAALLLLLSLSACAAAGENGGVSVGTGASAGLGVDADALLAKYDIEAPASATALIDQLQAQPISERSDGLMASVRVDELLLASGGSEVSVALPEDEFHLSIAPYLTETHECFYHSLTTCVGELGEEDFHVVITDDASEKVLFNGDIITFENGFFDVTLPEGLDITVLIDDGEHSVELPLGTGTEDPTCVTTAQLS